jgi:hypothetical protein
MKPYIWLVIQLKKYGKKTLETNFVGLHFGPKFVYQYTAYSSNLHIFVSASVCNSLHKFAFRLGTLIGRPWIVAFILFRT